LWKNPPSLVSICCVAMCSFSVSCYEFVLTVLLLDRSLLSIGCVWLIYARNVRLGRLHDSSNSYGRMPFTGTNPMILHFSSFGPLRSTACMPWLPITPLVTSPILTQADWSCKTWFFPSSPHLLVPSSGTGLAAPSSPKDTHRWWRPSGRRSVGSG
jgi:hypothetical protein